MLAIAAGLHFNLKVYIYCVKFVKGLQFVASVSQPSQACNRYWQVVCDSKVKAEN
jgi:hypothetical protein